MCDAKHVVDCKDARVEHTNVSQMSKCPRNLVFKYSPSTSKSHTLLNIIIYFPGNGSGRVFDYIPIIYTIHVDNIGQLAIIFWVKIDKIIFRLYMVRFEHMMDRYCII